MARKNIFLSNFKNSINILSLITIIAMAIGTASIIIVLSVYNGFEDLSISYYESFQPSLNISSKNNQAFEITPNISKILSQNDDILSISNTYNTKAYLKLNERESIVELKGVDNEFFKTNNIQNFLIYGDSVLEDENYSYALIGLEIAQKLYIDFNNSIDQIEVYIPKINSGISISNNSNFELSYLIPRSVFSIYQEFDSKYVIVPLSFVQYLTKNETNIISNIELKINENNIKKVKKYLEEKLGTQFNIKTRLESNESLYKMSKIEKIVTSIILSFIMFILSLNFLGSLSMHVYEKNSDIKMLNYLGVSKNNIFKFYMLIGVLQGFLGGLVGIIIGLIVCTIQILFGIVKLPGQGTFVIDQYPISLRLEDFQFIFVLIFFLSIIIGIFPSIKAYKICNDKY